MLRLQQLRQLELFKQHKLLLTVSIFRVLVVVRGGNKSLTINDLRVEFVNLFGNVFLVVTVQSNLGRIDFEVTNLDTGEYIEGELNAQPGSYPIPLSGSSGNYTALFILPDGRRVEREFVI